MPGVRVLGLMESEFFDLGNGLFFFNQSHLCACQILPVTIARRYFRYYDPFELLQAMSFFPPGLRVRRRVP